jgi:hypothetical protein
VQAGTWFLEGVERLQDRRAHDAGVDNGASQTRLSCQCSRSCRRRGGAYCALAADGLQRHQRRRCLGVLCKHHALGGNEVRFAVLQVLVRAQLVLRDNTCQ